MPTDLVSLGEAFEDIIFHDLTEWPRLGQEFRTRSLLRTWGGGALLTAVAAARQGLKVQVISGLAPAAVRFLKSESIRVRNLRRGDERHAVTVALSTREDRAFITYPGVNDHLESRFLECLPGLKASHLHLALEPRDCQAWSAALQHWRAGGGTCSWDFGWHADLARRAGFLQLLSQLDYLFLNEAEAAHYAGCDDWHPWWAERCGCVVVKLGKRGCVALHRGQQHQVNGLAVTAVDSTGAGDAFNGGFLAGLLRGADLPQALQLGNELGAASTEQAGGLLGLPRR